MGLSRRNLSGLFGLLACVAACACGGDSGTIEGGPPEVDCPPDSEVPRFDEVDAFSEVCTRCHASSLSGAQRHNAPSKINFDDYESAKPYAQKAAAEVYWGNMPPSGSGVVLTNDQIDPLLEWAMCGTPE